jgi:hypothetical protein
MSKSGNHIRIWVATLVIPLACGGVIVALLLWRTALEPIVRGVDWWLMARVHRGYSYDPQRYWLYVAMIAGVGAIIGLLGVWALKDKAASDRRLARYLDQQIVNQTNDHHRSL